MSDDLVKTGKEIMSNLIPCPCCGEYIEDFTKEIRIHNEVDGKTIKKYRVVCKHCGIILFDEEQQ